MSVSFFLAILAGILTVLAPCVLPLLPIIIGTSTQNNKLRHLIIIISSLSLSIFVFTLVLRTSLRFAPGLSMLDDSFWRSLSGVIILFFGFITVFPSIWTKISLFFNFQNTSDEFLNKARKSESIFAPALLGVSLGPVFSSCSPTYFVIVGLLFAESELWRAILLLLVYIAGLALILFAIGFLGNRLIKKLKWASNPNGWFKKVFGVLLIVIGVAIMFGFDRQFEAFLLNQEVYLRLQGFETNLMENQ